jgi:hypothetical protein
VTVATSVVLSPSATVLGEAVMRVTWGQVLKDTWTEALPLRARTVMVKETVAVAPLESVTERRRETGPVCWGATQEVERLVAEAKEPEGAVQA